MSGAIRDIVRSQEGLSYLVNMLRVRSVMTLEAVRGEIVIVAGLGSESRNLQFLKTVLDFLQEGRIIKVENDEVHYAGAYIGDMTGRAETPVKQVPPTKTDHEVKMPPKAGGNTVPIPLGVGRLVTLELPDDWNPARDLPKLLKMLELSLSDQEAPQGQPK